MTDTAEEKRKSSHKREREKEKRFDKNAKRWRLTSERTPKKN